MRRAATAAGAVLLFLAGGGCGGGHAEASRAFPAPVLPERVAGLAVTHERSAAEAFAEAGPTSMVARGEVWTLRQDDLTVQAALEVAQLKPEYDTREIETRRGVRGTIETGRYRWFKVQGQWVGVQELPEVRLYLWFPPRGDLFELLQVKPDVPGQKQLVEAIVEFQRESMS